MMYIIFTLIILVAAFNVASALIMMVKEKTRDIAILKAMGASPAALHRIFLAKGIVIGITGILIGVGLGLAVCGLLSRYQFIDLPGDVYFLTTLPVRIGFFDIGAIIIGTLAICVFSSVYPARQAARLDAVQGIRYG
jgi:lipoprotein-releasing system permease protein